MVSISIIDRPLSPPSWQADNICFNNQIAQQVITLVHCLNAKKVGSNLHDRQTCAPSDNGGTSCPGLHQQTTDAVALFQCITVVIPTYASLRIGAYKSGCPNLQISRQIVVLSLVVAGM
jgi:hypothetical protein